jgi:VanZ family protein
VRELRYRRTWIALGLAMAAIILVGSLLPSVPDARVLENDKINHFVGYFGLSAWFTALAQRRRYGVVVLALLAFGAAIEITQHLMPLGRTGDWRDVVANSIGIAAGLAVAFASRDSWLSHVERWIAVRT